MNAKRQQHWNLQIASLALVGLVCLVLPALPVARAEEPIKIQDNTYAYEFGSQLRFHLAVSGDVPIQSIVLAYRSSDTGGDQQDR